MKKLLFALPVILLLAAGCNSVNKTVHQTPAQNTNTQDFQTQQNSQPQFNNTTNTNSTSSAPSDSDIANATTVQIDLNPGVYNNTKSFQFDSLQFSLPWSDATINKQSDLAMSIQNQAGEKFLIIKDPQDEEILNSAMTQLKFTLPQMQQIFGKYADNNYNFANFVYNLTPTYLSQTSNNNKSLISALLSWKQTIITALPIYNFVTPSIHGFIFGGPTNKIRTMEIYTNTDSKYTIGLTNLNKSEVDFILSNIKSNQ